MTVSTDLPEVDTIALITRNNQHPLNTYVTLPGAGGFFKTRIRIEQHSPVTVYVKTTAGLFKKSRPVKISLGGYGMHGE